MFSVREIISDVRTAIIAWLVAGGGLLLVSIGGAIWKSMQRQPIPWAALIAIGTGFKNPASECSA